MSSYRIIGLMSGTSMDGLDIAYCSFTPGSSENWNYTIHVAQCVKYPEFILDKLKRSLNLSTHEIQLLDKDLGVFYANSVNDFIKQNTLDKNEIDAIASHGHTIFHKPEEGYTLQIGCGDTLAFQTGIQVINDFRQKDVVAGGQGAPLVPIGDKLLFNESYDAFLNIGGFTNICIPGEYTIAFDICPGNLPLNKLVEALNLEYDKDGEIAKSGDIDQELLNHLNSLEYYSRTAPKSLGTEWLESTFYPSIDRSKAIPTLLHTIIDHIAIQITEVLVHRKIKSVLITGGGAKNKFLIEKLRSKYNGDIVIPDTKLIDYKEAMIFAFLGVLFLENKPNTLASVTGAKRDVIGGVLHTI